MSRSASKQNYGFPFYDQSVFAGGHRGCIAMLVCRFNPNPFEKHRIRIARERVGNVSQRLEAVQLLIKEGRICA